MTLPVAFMLGLMAGCAIAWIARGPLRETSRPLRTRYGVVAAGFGVVLAAVATAHYLLEPAWSLMYLAHPEHASALVWPALTVGLMVGPAIGLKLGHASLARGIPQWFGLMVAVSATLLACLLLGIRRLGTVDFYEVFHYGAQTRPLTQSEIFPSVMVSSTLIPMLFAYCLVHIQRHAALTEAIPQMPSFSETPADPPPA